MAASLRAPVLRLLALGVQRQDFALLSPSQPGGQPSTELTVELRNSTHCSEIPMEFSIEIREGEGFRQSK